MMVQTIILRKRIYCRNMFLRWRRSQQAKEKREDTQRLEIAGIATAPSLD